MVAISAGEKPETDEAAVAEPAVVKMSGKTIELKRVFICFSSDRCAHHGIGLNEPSY
jgi:hypothetical protein